MLTRVLYRLFCLGAVLALLAACAPKPVEVDVELKVSIDGRPLAGAVVTVDNLASGATDARGVFAKTLSKVPEKPIAVTVQYDNPKLKTKAWSQNLVAQKRKEGEAKEKISVAVALQRYIVIAVQADGAPASGVQVTADQQPVGETNAQGEVEYELPSWPKKGLALALKKGDYGITRLQVRNDPGARIQAQLYKQSVVTIEALSERGQQTLPVKGATVFVGDQRVGATNERGVYVYHHKGELGGTGRFRIVAEGYIPGAVTRTVVLGGDARIQQFFYPVAAAPIRTAVLHFVANTAGEDMGEVLQKIDKEFVAELFDTKTFTRVPTETVTDLIKRSKLTPEKLQTNGWRNTSLAQAADVIVFGSVSRGEGDTYVIEVNFYRADGKRTMSQAAIAGSGGSWRVGRAVKEIVSNAVAAYPLEGRVIQADDATYRINLGKATATLDGDDVFTLYSAKRAENGRIYGYSEAGTLKVQRRYDDHTDLVADNLGRPGKPGDKVLRLDTSRSDVTDHVALVVKGGLGKDLAPLRGVNAYIEKKWVGTTNRDGEVQVPVRLNKRNKLMLYRHGYEQMSIVLEPKKDGRYEYALKSYSAMLTLESDPSDADIFLDDNKIGRTPLTKPYAVALGFHTLKLELGDDYRVWEEVLDFSKQNENRTGEHKIVLYKDILKLGEQAEEKGDVDGAIRIYSSAAREHPDYAQAHNRLGQIYFDRKHDYDQAVTEFERVQAIPEVRELVYKQYAVVYTNLGKAYYAKGERAYRQNRNEGVQYFSNAIKALDRAKENIRFFPNDVYDEAVHDTYYYRALAYHNLYLLTKKPALLNSADLAWQEYFDFFPTRLATRPEYLQMKEAGQKLWRQVQTEL